MTLSLIITNAGRAALVNVEHNGTAPVTIAQCGLSSTAVTPTVLATSLPGEFKRVGALSGSVVDADTIHLIVRDDSADIYALKSLALYLADGTLFGIYGQTADIVDKTAQSVMLLAVDVKFADIAATAITFGDTNFLNPQATETVKGVAETATQAETDAGTDDTRIVTPKKLAARLASWLASWGADIWRASNDGSGSGLDADLLDGQQGSWYADILARLGFTPANKAGDTFTGNVTVSGTGSAQLLTTGDVRASQFGGATGAYYFGAGTGQYLNYSGGNYVLNGANLYCGPGNNLVWNAGNDGSGSGCDADLLDGIHASGFLQAINNVWVQSVEGARRFFFGTNGATYLGTSLANGTAWIFQNANSVNVAQLATTGDFSTIGPVTSAGSGSASLSPTGDVTAARAGGITGLYNFGTAGGGRYLYYDGANYFLQGAWLYVNGGYAWNSANDGSGSGLDADLLDGQDSSFYTDVVSRLGYAPVSRNGDTMGGKLISAGGVTGNNGVGTTAGAVGSFEVQSNGTGAAMISFHRVGTFAAYLGLDTDNQWKVGGWSMGANAYALWHAGNDGSGSGMDTDLWRGQTPQQLIDSQFSHGSNGNGDWRRRPVGGSAFDLEQRGQNTNFTNVETVVQVDLPTPFANTNYRVAITPAIDTDNSFTDMWVQIIRSSKTASSFQVKLQGTNTSNAFLYGFEWIAIGDAP